MTNHSIGRQAEVAASYYLQEQNFKILARNWRTRYCEIDIVALHKQTIYFIEVKHRTSDRQGSGLDYITPKKLQQMHFAAQMWISNHGWRGEANLGAIEVSGPEFTVTEFVTDL